MSVILEVILEETAAELDRRMREIPLSSLEGALASSDPVRDFHGALQAEGPVPSVIAEVKRASPSKGLLREEFNPVDLPLGGRGSCRAASASSRHRLSRSFALPILGHPLSEKPGFFSSNSKQLSKAHKKTPASFDVVVRQYIPIIRIA